MLLGTFTVTLSETSTPVRISSRMLPEQFSSGLPGQVVSIALSFRYIRPMTWYPARAGSRDHSKQGPRQSSCHVAPPSGLRPQKRFAAVRAPCEGRGGDDKQQTAARRGFHLLAFDCRGLQLPGRGG